MKNNKIFSKFSFIIIILLAIITNLNVAYAKQITGEITVEVSKDGIETPNRQSKKEEAKNESKSIREESREKIQNLINEATKVRVNFINETKTIKEEAKNKIEEIKTKFKESLSVIKDENKKKSAENIINSINDLNVKLTDQLLDKITQIENVLVGVESRIQKGEEKGLDMSKSKDLVSKAKESISSSKKAILAQSEKTYTTTVTDEITLKSKIKGVRDTFKTDIKNVRETVVNAHKAVKNVATNLAQTPKINDTDDSENVKTNDVTTKTQ